MQDSRKSALVRTFGFPATLIHGDTLVLDRWRWLRQRLPRVPQGSKRLLDVGCGTGAFTIGASLRGYQSLGLSWDTRNQAVARERAKMCKAPLAEFEVCDVRKLGEHPNLEGGFDVVVCCENIEHILDDAKLVRDMALCMKPGGTLLLTTPNVSYRPISEGDNGPFLPIEDGRHVRKGYSPEDLQRLCAQAFLRVKEINYIAGFFSQKTTRLYRSLNCGVHPVAGWTTILPLRIVPPLLDDAVSKVVGWPGFSITLVAQKAAAPDA